ncbi:MAG: adenylyltransferase/cytidyltransferase family protein, partial [Bacteroidales bacterium]|nr:adenylyltransferase/cytidyltransferase family protein [Bacteroidales bacterium]
MFDEVTLLPMSSRSVRAKVEAFLERNGLRPAPLDCYAAILDDDERIVAGGGLDGDVIKCVAVSEEARSGGCTNKLISFLVNRAVQQGYGSVKVFTKPSNAAVFGSLGFSLLASAPEAVLMENGRIGLNGYERYLSGLRRPGRNGVIVMNANPFTLGHRYLVEQASRKVDNLYVIAVKEDRSRFPYAERK